MGNFSRLLSLQGIIGILVLPALSNLTAEVTLPIWQLTHGQKFSVQTTTHRNTEIQVGDYREVSDVTDSAILQYVMFGFDRQGRAQLEVRIESLNRVTHDESGKAATESLVPERALKSPGTAIVVSDDGNTVNVLGSRSVFRTGTSLSQRLLNQLSGEGVFESWVNMPFRIPVKTNNRPSAPIKPQEGEKQLRNDDAIADSVMRVDSDWTRIQHISIGLPGTVECETHYLIESIKDQRAQIRIDGSLHLKHRESPQNNPLIIADFEFNSSNLSGEGHILVDQITGLPHSIQMTETMSLGGRSTVTSGDVSQQMQFRQRLTHSWTASEFRLKDVSEGISIPQQIQVR